MKSTGDVSAEPVRGRKSKNIFLQTDLDGRNDENRPSSTTCAAAEERQEVSSKNTTDELSDIFTEGKDIWHFHWRKKQFFDIVMKRHF